MKISRLILREISHRKLNFLLSLLGVVTAVALSYGVLTLLRSHDLQSAHLLTHKQQELADTNAAYDDKVRKITKNLGFNVMILPKDQNLADLYASNSAIKFMPESYATDLAASTILTVRHLLPIIEQRVKWPERKDRTIFLVGIRKQVPVAHRAPKKPIQQPILPGEAIMGAELARTEEVKVGDSITFMGRSVRVTKIHPERGTKDDVSLYINLDTVQELLDKKGQINAINALECKCAFSDLAKIRGELATLLPNTQVIEFKSKALARSEARRAAVIQATKLVDQEKAGHQKILQQNQTLAAILMPVDIAIAAIWVGLLALSNVRERKPEIGVLRALGIRSSQVMTVFLSKATLIGLVGAMIGVAVGFGGGVAAAQVGGNGQFMPAATDLFAPKASALMILLTPLLVIAATWLPALSASQQDPAEVLREE
jgi:putative ABC transport system permease protein